MAKKLSSMAIMAALLLESMPDKEIVALHRRVMRNVRRANRKKKQIRKAQRRMRKRNKRGW